jgi:hypothetical protein
MSSIPNLRRSQQIMRLPVDDVTATLILHDGDRSEVVLFVSPDEDIVRVLTAREPFLPMRRAGKLVLVARAAIAALGLPSIPTIASDDELPVETQAAMLRLRSGQTLEGELRWTAPAGAKRTADFLNDDEAHVTLYAGKTTYYVIKDQIALVEERGC